MICPLCGKSLQLKQINLNTAILLCLDVKCPYPVDNECIQVHRKLKDMNQKQYIGILPVNKNPTNSNDANEIDPNEVFAALDNAIKKQSENAQRDCNDELNLVELIGDFNNENVSKNNTNEENVIKNNASTNNIVKNDSEETSFDIDNFLTNYFY